MGVKFFCDGDGCGKEIWQGLSQWIKDTETISEAERDCLCSDCLLKASRENRAEEEDIERE